MKRVLLPLLLAFLLAILVVAGWFSYQAYQAYSVIKSDTSVQVPTMTDEPTVTIPPLNGNQRINVLVLGSDNDKKKEERRPLTQSMIIVSIDPVHYKVTMLSIPRDFWVPIEGHGWGKIDLAHKYGGVSLARATVHKLFGIPIHFYAWVGLEGFEKVIDTFNGVTVDVPHPILDDNYPDDLNSLDPYGYKRIFIPAGWQHMNGMQALEFVRSRHGDYFGDFGRSHRQQEILLQLDHKVNAMQVALNLPKLFNALRDSVKTDLSLPQIYQLEQMSHHITQNNVQQVVLQPPYYSNYGWSKDGQSIIVPHWKRIHQLVKRLFAPLNAGHHVTHRVPGPRPTVVSKSAAHRTTQPSAAKGRKVSSTKTKKPTTPRPTATITPTPTPTPAPATMDHLPAHLFYVLGGNIFEADRDGSTHQLTFTGDAAMPKPSPDRRTLAFIRFVRQGNASQIWLLNLRTRKEHPITGGTNARDVRNDLWAAWPTWWPNGKGLYYSWDRDKLSQAPSDARPIALAIWSVGRDGSHPTQLTTPRIGGSGDTEAVTRPGHDQIAYIKWDYYPKSFQPYSRLVLYDHRTGHLWYLTPVGGRVIQPAWNNTGTEITFSRQQPDGSEQIVVAPILTRHGVVQLGPRRVIATGPVMQPSFTPDGRYVSYLRLDGNNFTMELLRLSDGRVFRLDHIPDDIDTRWHPVWMP